MKKQKIIIVGLVWAVAVVVVWPARGQNADRLERFQRQLDQIRMETQLRVAEDIPVDQRTLFDAGAYAAFFLLALDDRDGENHVLRQSDLTMYGRANLDDVHQFFVRGRIGWQDFNGGDSFDGDGDSGLTNNLDRAFYRFDLRRASEAYEGETTDHNLVIQVGRQFVYWGNGLVLAEAIDGGTFGFELGDLQLDVVGGKTYEERADFDASRPNFTDNLDRDFFGGMVGYQLTPNHNLFGYGLAQFDQNNQDTATVRYGYDSYYLGAGLEGNLGQNILYGLEAVYEGGSSVSTSSDVNLNSVSQTNEEIEAWAVDARLDYLVNDSANTRFEAEVLLASGDDDRAFSTSATAGGNLSGTKDKAFNAFGLIDTGFVFSPNTSNLVMLRLGASTYPLNDSGTFKRLQIGADFFIYHKMDSGAPSTEITDDDGFLGTEIDLSANWQITSDFSWSILYGVFFPGEAIAGSSLGALTTPGESNARQFVYSGFTLAF